MRIGVGTSKGQEMSRSLETEVRNVEKTVINGRN